MFRRSLSVQKGMITTRGGMRRILKQRLPTLEYMRKAVDSGVYRTREEVDRMLRERTKRPDELRDIMRRFRQNIVRGTYVADYPAEYMIIRQNPPPPLEPVISKKDKKKMLFEEKTHKIDKMQKLVKAYLRREERSNDAEGYTFYGDHQSPESTAPLTSEDYYQRLLGVSAPPVFDTHMGRKSAPVQRAYAKAQKHYELVRTKGLSDKEAVKEVEAILKQTRQNETHQAMEKLLQTKDFQFESNKKHLKDLIQEYEQQTGQSARDTLLRNKRYMERMSQKVEEDYPSPEMLNADNNKQQKPISSLRRARADPEEGRITDAAKESASPETDLEKLFDTVLGSKPTALEAMMRWSNRLQQTPYSEWTVGASTALDHWIARQILQMSEETWQTLIEGQDPSLLHLGKAIVQTREALFPETNLGPALDDDDDGAYAMGDDAFSLDEKKAEDDTSDFVDVPTEPSDSEQQLEDLLKSLGNLTLSPEEPHDFSLGSKSGIAPDEAALEDAAIKLTKELQVFRQQNSEKPFSDWKEEEKLKFQLWFEDSFVPTMLPDNTDAVDWEATKLALLNGEPVTEEESDAFWSATTTEQEAVKLLDQMLLDGPPKGATILQQAFWDLSYDEQLQQLLNLGAIRPMLDEYTSGKDRLTFIQKHYDILLSGVPLDVLVPDNEDGAISAEDLQGTTLARELGLRKNSNAKFRLAKVPYRTDGEGKDAMTQARTMFLAWNEFKANRARYEEALFQNYEQGIRYGDDPLEITKADPEDEWAKHLKEEREKKKKQDHKDKK